MSIHNPSIEEAPLRGKFTGKNTLYPVKNFVDAAVAGLPRATANR